MGTGRWNPLAGAAQLQVVTGLEFRPLWACSLNSQTLVPLYQTLWDHGVHTLALTQNINTYTVCGRRGRSELRAKDLPWSCKDCVEVGTPTHCVGLESLARILDCVDEEREPETACVHPLCVLMRCDVIWSFKFLLP